MVEPRWAMGSFAVPYLWWAGLCLFLLLAPNARLAVRDASRTVAGRAGVNRKGYKNVNRGAVAIVAARLVKEEEREKRREARKWKSDKMGHQLIPYLARATSPPSCAMTLMFWSRPDPEHQLAVIGPPLGLLAVIPRR